MGAVTVTIRTMDDAGTPAPIDGVAVRIFTNADIFVTEGVTGSPTPGSGEAEFTLDADGVGIDYIVRLYKQGVSFPPAPTFSISVTDPPSPDNDFEFTGHIGLVGQVIELVVSDDAPTPAAVEDVRVRIFDAADTFLLEADTDSVGKVSAVLGGAPDPGISYIVRLSKALHTIQGGPTQLIYVLDPVSPPDTNVFDFTAAPLTDPESSDPNLCLLHGYLIDISGRPLAKKELKLVPQPFVPTNRVGGSSFPHEPSVIERKMIASGSRYTTDENGYVEILLPRDSIVDVVIRGLDTMYNDDQQLAQIYVPDAASGKLEDVLFPYIESVVYGTDPINIVEGETVQVDLTVTDVNGRVIEGTTPISALVLFTSSDEDVASVELDEEGKLSVTGLSAGSATIEATRIERTYALRRPDVPALVATPPTVTVT